MAPCNINVKQTCIIIASVKWNFFPLVLLFFLLVRDRRGTAVGPCQKCMRFVKYRSGIALFVRLVSAPILVLLNRVFVARKILELKKLPKFPQSKQFFKPYVILLAFRDLMINQGKRDWFFQSGSETFFFSYPQIIHSQCERPLPFRRPTIPFENATPCKENKTVRRSGCFK